MMSTWKKTKAAVAWPFMAAYIFGALVVAAVALAAGNEEGDPHS